MFCLFWPRIFIFYLTADTEKLDHMFFPEISSRLRIRSQFRVFGIFEGSMPLFWKKIEGWDLELENRVLTQKGPEGWIFYMTFSESPRLREHVGTKISLCSSKKSEFLLQATVIWWRAINYLHGGQPVMVCDVHVLCVMCDIVCYIEIFWGLSHKNGSFSKKMRFFSFSFHHPIFSPSIGWSILIIVFRG